MVGFNCLDWDLFSLILRRGHLIINRNVNGSVNVVIKLMNRLIIYLRW